MKHQDLLKQKQLIDTLFQDVNTFTKNQSHDPLIESFLAKYICVQVSGFLQNCVRIIFSNYTTPRTQDHVTNYVSKKVGKFPNPTFDAILSLAGEFNPNWKASFIEQVPKNSRLRSSLDSINVNRNAIAHGGTSTIRIGDIKQYYDDAVILITKLELCCI